MLEVQTNKNWRIKLVLLLTLVCKKIEAGHWLTVLIKDMDHNIIKNYRFLDYSTYLNVYFYYQTRPLPESTLLNEFHRDKYLAIILSNYLLERAIDPNKALLDLESHLMENRISKAEISMLLKIKIPRLVKYRLDHPENHSDFTYNQIQVVLSEYLKKHSPNQFRIVIGILMNIIDLEYQVNHVPKAIFRLDPRLYNLVPKYLQALRSITDCKDLDMIKAVLSTRFPDVSISDFSIFLETYLPKILEDYIKPNSLGEN